MDSLVAFNLALDCFYLVKAPSLWADFVDSQFIKDAAIF